MRHFPSSTNKTQVNSTCNCLSATAAQRYSLSSPGPYSFLNTNPKAESDLAFFECSCWSRKVSSQLADSPAAGRSPFWAGPSFMHWIAGCLPWWACPSITFQQSYTEDIWFYLYILHKCSIFLRQYIWIQEGTLYQFHKVVSLSLIKCVINIWQVRKWVPRGWWGKTNATFTSWLAFNKNPFKLEIWWAFSVVHLFSYRLILKYVSWLFQAQVVLLISSTTKLYTVYIL